MFGLVVTNPDSLLPDAREHYRGVYCGVCRALGENRSAVNRLTLTYDLAFLALFLSAVAGEEYETTDRTCPVHPFSKHRCDDNRFVKYAADMNILLAYYKYCDDVNDDNSVSARVKAKLFCHEAERIAARYKKQSDTIKTELSFLTEAEKRNETNPDIPAASFGRLMGAIFTPDGVTKAEELYNFGFSLGKVIYLMDAAVDLRKDLKKMRYNPLVGVSSDTIPVMLNVLLGECADAYEKLNVTHDNDIIENILFSGIWTAYAVMQRKGEKKSGTESV